MTWVAPPPPAYSFLRDRRKIYPRLGEFGLLAAWGCSTLCRLVERQGFSKKVTMVQGEDIKLLRRIVAGGGRKYTGRKCGPQQIRPTGRPRMADAIQDER